ncbi:unnamed protein product, partial [Staurois parvus]
SVCGFLQEPSCNEGSNALEDHCFNQACLRLDLVVLGTSWSFILRDNYRNSGFETTPIKLKKIKKGHKENMMKQEGMSWKFSITGCPLKCVIY